MKKMILLSMMLIIFNTILNAQTNTKIAVLDFQSNGTPQFIGNAIADIITTEFKNDKDIIILERNQIQQILKERSYLKNSTSDLNGAIEFGQILAVDRIIVGSVSRIGNSYTITGKIIEIRSGSVEYAESENCAVIDDIEVATRYLATKLLNRISMTYHELPEKKYHSKLNNDQVEVSLSARYGIIWGFKVPQISVPVQSTDSIKITDVEENINVTEVIVASDFYLYKGLSMRGLLKYSIGSKFRQEPDTSRFYDSTEYVFYDRSSTPENFFQGFGLGAGVQYSFNYSRFSPYISTDLILTRYWFKELFEQNFSVSTAAYSTWSDYQTYKISYAQYSDVISTEITAGFKVLLTEKFGLNCAFGAAIPIYGAQFSEFDIEKTSSYTENGTIPLQNRDLDTKLKYNEKDFIQPPTYFIQLGFVLRV